MKKHFLVAVALVGAVSMGGCQTQQQQNAANGAVLGGATGALIGGLASGRAGGALAGGALGAATGALIGGSAPPPPRVVYVAPPPPPVCVRPGYDEFGNPICLRYGRGYY